MHVLSKTAESRRAVAPNPKGEKLVDGVVPAVEKSRNLRPWLRPCSVALVLADEQACAESLVFGLRWTEVERLAVVQDGTVDQQVRHPLHQTQ